MEKDLIEVFAVARRAADAAAAGGERPADVDRCVDALLRLTEMPVTVKVLLDTQVGKQLRTHLTKHPVKKIQKAASELCELWKKKVIEETARNKTSCVSGKQISKQISGDTDRPESAKVEKMQKSVKAAMETISRADAIKVERRDLGDDRRVESISRVESTRVEKMIKQEKRPAASPPKPKLSSMVKCNDPLRDKTRELFADALSKVSGEAGEDLKEEVEASDPIRMAVMLESAMFDKLGRSNGNHKQKYRSILFNLKDMNNPDLRRRVLLGEIVPEVLITMSAEDMASDARKRKNMEIKEKAMFECERGGPPKATTDQFKCGRCGQRKCTYHQMQTRSADEPMTTFVTCVNCNNHWKFC